MVPRIICLFTTPFQDNRPKSHCFWHRSQATTTTTHDAKLWFCLIQDKTPNATWLYHKLIQQPHFYHLRHGIPYPKQWVQQRWLADSLIWDNFTKRTASVRSYGALVKWEDSQYNNPTLDFNHMSIYNTTRIDIWSFDTNPRDWKYIYHHVDTTKNMPFGAGPNICIC